MKIFPHTLVRIGGESFDTLKSLESEGLSAWLAEVPAQNRKYHELREKLSPALLLFIQSTEDSQAQKILQNLRRDLFNERRPKLVELEFARKTLDASTLQLLEHILQAKIEITAFFEKGQCLYENAVITGRQKIQQIAVSENLLKGLLLSSQVLSRQVEKYAKAKPDSVKKDELQVEHSILKYFTRMTAKTSPFSTFTNLVKGKITDEESGLSLQNLSGDSFEDVRSHIRLNNYLLQYLKTILSHNQAVVRELPVRVNPTLEIRGDHYLFLTNHNNIESFQRISTNPLTDFLLQLIREKGNPLLRTLTVDALEEIDSTEEELIAFINQLIGYGLLEVDFGVSGIDPEWDEKLIPRLLPLAQRGVTRMQALIDALNKIRGLARQYELAGADQRLEIIDQAFHCFRLVCMQLHEDAGLPEAERKDPEMLLAEFVVRQKELKKQAQQAVKKNALTANGNEGSKSQADDAPVKIEEGDTGQTNTAFKHQSSSFFPFKQQQIFYEDSTRPSAIHVNQRILAAHLENLRKVMSCNNMFRGNYEEQLKMADYFINKYGSDSEVSLLTFYEDFYRDVKKPENERINKPKIVAANGDTPPLTNDPKFQDALPPFNPLPKQEPAPEASPGPLVSHFRKNRDNFHSKIKARLASLISKSDTVMTHIKLDDDLLHDFMGSSEDAAGPHGAFLQLFGEKDGIRKGAVVNATFPGFGKMFGRFLHVFDESLLTDLRKWNEEVGGTETILMENTDASYFNANLHPPLLCHEIRIPGGHNSLDPQHQLAVSEFSVNLCSKENILQLIHIPTGKRAFVLDLGFQGHMGRSQLFQLLDKFSKSEYLSPAAVNNIINGICSELSKQENHEVKIIPRISYGDNLILQRKKWTIPMTALPVRPPNESDFDFYKRIILWKHKLDLPDDVFVFAFQRTFSPAKKGGKAGRDDYKPQYINFRVPSLVNLFERLIKKVDDQMRIEEMLPAPEQLLSIDDQRYVTENVVEWNG